MVLKIKINRLCGCVAEKEKKYDLINPYKTFVLYFNIFIVLVIVFSTYILIMIQLEVREDCPTLNEMECFRYLGEVEKEAKELGLSDEQEGNPSMI